MDALVTAFVAAFLAGWGDPTQRVTARLSARTGRPGLVILGLLAAIVASSVVAGAAGVLVAGTVPVRAMSLMVALALLYSGVAGLIPRRDPSLGSMTLPAVLIAAILSLAAEMGERAQFLTFALAGRFDSLPLTAAGAAAGTLAACLPAALLGDAFFGAVPLRAIRYAVAGLFLIAGFIVAVGALGLA
ncbi:TMEM165/GDT1 family protein [Sphingosinicella sp. LHD-64]|uniref:TMEM165/GDT1 family protein n=1 Tax=Sphingosinicella sp. LHD-64 TaxID=3072139 RepID=UPI00280C5A5D|nr:TMEM165/GDT1 family protein [Sphingosinicella sp. LHD-64]MDQ8756818.1 TMEM165/GDT1 family protein [Sphingosinicella sp. LHD-64]